MPDIRILLLVALLGLLSGATADPQSVSVKDFMENPDRGIVLRGDYFKAAAVAFRDFPKDLARNEANGKRSSDTNAKAEDYDILISQSDSSFVVQILPKIRDREHVVFGGGMTYMIDRKTFAITDRSVQK
jgi:hypothetical protein